MKAENKIERMVKESRYKAKGGAYDKGFGSFMGAVDDYQKQKPTLGRSSVSRTIRRVGKVAAVMVFVAVIIGLHQINSSLKGRSIVWADVAERLKGVSSFKAKASRVLTEVDQEEPFFEGEVLKYFSPDHGHMEESYVGGEIVMLAYPSISEKSLLIVFPQNKAYCRFDYNEELLSLFENINPANTDGIMKYFGSDRCVRLGGQEIDGVMSEGFEVKDVKVFSQVPRFLMEVKGVDIRLWVNKETLLPIRLEGEGFIGKGLMTGFKDIRYREVVYDVEYDVEINESVFEPNIPEDYKLIDPASMAEKAEMIMLGVLPVGAGVAGYRRFKKKQV